MTYEEFYQILKKVDPSFKFYGLAEDSLSTHVNVVNKYDEDVCAVHKQFESYELYMTNINHFSYEQRRALVDALTELASTEPSERYKSAEDKNKYYWRVKNSLEERGSVGYLNIIEGGEAIMIYNRKNSERYQTLITIREFEELQDRFKLEVSEYIREPENTIRVEDIKDCPDCPEHKDPCLGWGHYQKQRKRKMKCSSWRHGDIVGRD